MGCFSERGGRPPNPNVLVFILLANFIWLNVEAKATIPRIYKCSESVSPDFILIPDFLQIKYVEAKKKWFTEKLHPHRLYNFSLPILEGGLKCPSFRISIGRTETVSSPLPDDYYFFTPDGFLNYNRETPGEPGQEITFHPNNYCISRISKSQITVRACKSTCGTRPDEKGSALCIRKCCTFGQVRTAPNGTCEDVRGGDWAPQIWPDLDSTQNSLGIYPQFERTDYKNWNCSSTKTDRPLFHTQADLRILANGRTFWKKSGYEHWKQMFPRSESHKFCLDGFWNISTGADYNPDAFEYYSLRCDLSASEETELRNSKTDPNEIRKASALAYHHSITFSIFLITALIFLGLMGVYASLWRVQNVHGWTVFVFLVTSFMYNITRCAQSGWFAFGDTGALLSIGLRPVCVSMGLLLQFSIIGCYAWTTVFSFDVWGKIRSMQTQAMGYKGHKKFLAYCLAGFTIPTIWVIVTVVMEFGSGFKLHEPDDGIVRPGIRRYCQVDDVKFVTYFLYVGLPIIFLFVTNMVLASSTVKFIWDTKKNITSVSDSKSANTSASVKLAFKLFVMMGLFLVVETLQTFRSLSFYSVHWVWLEVYRIFHAIGLAWILVANGRVLRQLSQVFPLLGRFTKDSTTSSSGLQPKQSTQSTNN